MTSAPNIDSKARTGNEWSPTPNGLRFVVMALVVDANRSRVH